MSSTPAWILIGTFIGFLLHWLIDRLFWSNRRVCTEVEKKLRTQVAEYDNDRRTWETSKTEYDQRIAKYDRRIAGYDRRVNEYETKIGDYETQISDYEVKTADLQTRLRAPKVADIAADVTVDAPAITSPTVDLPKRNFFGRSKVAPPPVDVPDVDPPTIDVPEIDLPKVDVPEVDLQKPEIDLPKVDMPEVDLQKPEIDLPKVDVPEVDLQKPEIDLPKVDMPEVDLQKPEIDLPKVDMPEVDLQKPEIDLPKVDVPDVDLQKPEIELPKVDVPEVDLQKPEIDLPKVDVPEVNLQKPEIELPQVAVDAPEIELPTASGIGAGAKAGIVGAGAAVAGGAGVFGRKLTGRKANGDDDLTELWGIGRSVEQTLNASEINTYQNLADRSIGDLQAIVDAEGDRYADVEVSTWPAQAQLAADGKWDALNAMKRDLARTTLPADSTFTGEPDNFQKLYGIGPASEKLLYANGIYTYEQLGNTPVADLQAMLDAKGGRMKLVDPATWPEQARFATAGDWDALDKMQGASGGVTGAVGAVAGGAATVGTTAAATAKSAATGRDDLKKIWGIGPAVERVLNSANIATFDQLANSSVDQLRDILSNAGERFNMIQPDSWPEQARLADARDWETLEKLQATLGN